MTQVKITWSFINYSNCEVADSLSFNCKNDMWTEITSPCKFRGHIVRMPQVSKWTLAWSQCCITFHQISRLL